MPSRLHITLRTPPPSGTRSHGRATTSTLAPADSLHGAFPSGIRRRPVPQQRERLFDRHATAVRAARDFIAGTLSLWRIDDRTDDVELCVSELATNAVEHGV